MQRLLSEGTRDTEKLQQSIEYLEQTNQSLLEHMRSLQAARHDVLERARKEKEFLSREQQEAERVRKVLEQLRGPGQTSVAGTTNSTNGDLPTSSPLVGGPCVSTSSERGFGSPVHG